MSCLIGEIVKQKKLEEEEFFIFCCGVIVESCRCFSLKHFMSFMLPPAESNFSEIMNLLSLQRPIFSCYKFKLYNAKAQMVNLVFDKI